LVVGALLSLGIDVIDLGMASTPTVEMAVVSQDAQGGIIISASHNPQGWNALKLLNCDSEFLSAEDGLKVLSLADEDNHTYVSEENGGVYIFNPYLEWDHVHKIESLSLVDKELVKEKDFKVVVDGINSVGAKAISHVLEMLGVNRQIIINDSMDGRFTHNPEPLEKNLGEIMERVKSEGADLGIVVDPDVDRLAFIDENGKMFGEEYTLVAISNYVLENFSTFEKLYPGKYKLAAVSNLSSSRALKDVVSGYGGEYEASAVGEVNVVTKMKEIKAVIGGEGNGGIIFPELHYGRDALLGVALFLSYLAKTYKKVSEIRKNLPSYFMVKDRLVLKDGFNLNTIINKLKEEYKLEKISTIDGIKIDFKDSWAHLRASNTEPILRIYTEAKTRQEAQDLNNKIKEKVLIFI
ncbi:MAG TPA: phosphoglucosamine mutase, partial [Patescibacteria group bacterium]|nr:phosphoglucosamine mutase [Patescibacteria group bacterium]